jgi:hypothetical protein
MKVLEGEKSGNLGGRAHRLALLPGRASCTDNASTTPALHVLPLLTAGFPPRPTVLLQIIVLHSMASFLLETGYRRWTFPKSLLTASRAFIYIRPESSLRHDCCADRVQQVPRGLPQEQV